MTRQLVCCKRLFQHKKTVVHAVYPGGGTPTALESDVENLIDTAYLPGSSGEKMYVNMDSATRQGFEIVFNAQVSKTFFDRITLRLGIDHISDQDLNDAPYGIEGRMLYAGVNFKFQQP